MDAPADLRPSLIVAMSQNRVIGAAGGLPWRMSADLRRFRELTMGHAIIMGRKTYDSIGRPLPGRRSIVITSNPAALQSEPSMAPPSGQAQTSLAFVPSLTAAFELAQRAAEPEIEIFIIGGGQVFEEAMPYITRMYISHIETDIAGDTFFPVFAPHEWRLAREESYPADERNQFPHRFCIYDRVK